MAISTDYIRTSLQNLYGDSIATGDIKAWCAMNGTAYSTVCKKLENFKVGRGKWNLEVTSETIQDLEESYNVPSAEKQILIPEKNDTLSSLVILVVLKKLLSPVYFIRRLLRVSLVMARRSQLSKRVLSWVVN